MNICTCLLICSHYKSRKLNLGWFAVALEAGILREESKKAFKNKAINDKLW